MDCCTTESIHKTYNTFHTKQK